MEILRNPSPRRPRESRGRLVEETQSSSKSDCKPTPPPKWDITKTVKEIQIPNTSHYLFKFLLLSAFRIPPASPKGLAQLFLRVSFRIQPTATVFLPVLLTSHPTPFCTFIVWVDSTTFPIEKNYSLGVCVCACVLSVCLCGRSTVNYKILFSGLEENVIIFI